MAKAKWEPAKGRHRHEGRKGNGSEPERALKTLYFACSRGFTEASADGLHRPVSVPYRRSGDAFGRNSGNLFRINQTREGQGHRRIQLQRGTAFSGVADQ